MATVKEIAEKSGVSIGTVDRVLHNRGRVSPETRKRVLAIADELQYVPNRVAQSLATRKKRLHLGFVQIIGEGRPFFTDINTAAHKKAEDLAEYGVKVSFLTLDIDCLMDSDFKAGLSVPQDVNLKELDGLVLPGRLVYSRIRDKICAGCPVVFYNQYPECEEALAYIGCDYGRAGNIAAGLCVLSGGRRARIAILSEGMPDRQILSYTERVREFRRRLETEYPDSTVAGELFFSGDYSENVLRCKYFLRKHPDITVAYVVNPGDYRICGILRKYDPDRRIRIITNDLGQTQKEMLRNGSISATITQQPEVQGSYPLQILYEYLAFGKKPQDKNIYTKLEIRVAGNMDF